MSAATSSGTPDRPVVTAPIAPAVLAAMAGRVGESMAVGNEGGGVVVAAGSSPEAQALLGRTVGVLGGSTYSRVPVRPRVAGPGAARRRDVRTRRGVLRQPAHRARHGRHDAARGTHGVGPHRGRLQPRPDAQPAVSRRLDRARQHRAPRRAGAAAARPGRGARLQLVGGQLPRRPHRRADDDRCDDRVRRHRRRRVASQILTAHGAGGERPRHRVQPVRLDARTSRSTSTAASIGVPPNSTATSAWRGASPAGCSRRT